MFYLIRSGINYTEAEKMCQNKSSMLADVSSERRTNALAQLLVNANTNYAYVGLQRTYKDFMTSNGIIQLYKINQI